MKKICPKVKLMFFISEDWYFWSHRRSLALSAINKGWEVYLVTRVSNLQEQIKKSGIHLSTLRHFKRGFQNPIGEIKSFIEIIKIYKKIKPDIVHQVALKPILVGTLSARIVGIPCIINAFAGMGFMFTNKSLFKTIILIVFNLMLRILCKSGHIMVIFQNTHDLMQLIRKKIINIKQGVLIKGSGVDTRRFHPGNEKPGIPLVVLPSRMLWDKGIGEFVEAARRINSKNQVARFVLVGSPDPENPATISQEQLESWHSVGVIEWWGHQKDMSAVYEKAHIVCLPSYREGLPKVLLEAGAAGKPAVTTDTIGCKDIIRHGENGVLVEPRNAVELARGIETLIHDPVKRRMMGARARKIIEDGYSDEHITASTFSLYKKMLAESKLEKYYISDRTVQ